MFKFLNKMKKNRKGYTLTELIVVVAILGILAAVATPMILNQVNTARENTDAANAKTIENAYKLAIATADPAPATPTDRAGVSAILGNTLNPIPTPERDGFNFYLDNGTGRVVCAAAAPAPSATTGVNVIDLTP